LEAEGLAQAAVRKLGLTTVAPQLDEWSAITRRILHPRSRVRVALVGKYVELKDAYISIVEALNHGGVFHDAQVDIDRIDSESVERDGVGLLQRADGILVAPGFGARGVRGKLAAIRYARENGVPFLGICYGMQLACIEFARSVCGLPEAMTSEVDETTSEPVIDFMPDQRNLETYGGTMRLGTYACTLDPASLAAAAYGRLDISERHRHRYEFNNRYRPVFEEHGMRFTGHHTIGKTRLVEVIELPQSLHPWFVGTQAHPEFMSRPNRPSPLYRDFIGAALRHNAPSNATPHEAAIPAFPATGG
jgi:CTP synthase